MARGACRHRYAVRRYIPRAAACRSIPGGPGRAPHAAPGVCFSATLAAARRATHGTTAPVRRACPHGVAHPTHILQHVVRATRVGLSNAASATVRRCRACARVRRVFQGGGRVWEDTEDELGWGRRTAKGFTGRCGDDGGGAPDAAASAGGIPACCSVCKCTARGTKWAAATRTSGSTERPSTDTRWCTGPSVPHAARCSP